jgi:hypothetical protein
MSANSDEGSKRRQARSGEKGYPSEAVLAVDLIGDGFVDVGPGAGVGVLGDGVVGDERDEEFVVEVDDAAELAVRGTVARRGERTSVRGRSGTRRRCPPGRHRLTRGLAFALGMLNER